MLKCEGNLLYLKDPITIIGDIHVQIYYLMKILTLSGNQEENK